MTQELIKKLSKKKKNSKFSDCCDKISIAVGHVNGALNHSVLNIGYPKHICALTLTIINKPLLIKIQIKLNKKMAFYKKK